MVTRGELLFKVLEKEKFFLPIVFVNLRTVFATCIFLILVDTKIDLDKSFGKKIITISNKLPPPPPHHYYESINSIC